MKFRHRRRFGREFKIEAVRQTYESGKTVSQVARELNIRIPLLSKWREQVKTATTHRPAEVFKKSVPSELEKLRRENARLRDERDILKKSRYVLRERVSKRYQFVEDTGENSRCE